MDMSGAMPQRAYVEIYNEAGELVLTLASRISGGTITTEYPGFPAGTRGRKREVWVFADSDPNGVGEPSPNDLPLEELPTEPVVIVSQVG
jgi:hypothetical protein